MQSPAPAKIARLKLRSILRCWFTIAVAFAVAGCGGGGRSLRVDSLEHQAQLRAEMGIQAYVSTDANSADVYLTDLPQETLDPGADLSHTAGNLIHLHLFINPEAGRTPIDPTACTVTIRHIVLANGEVGVYGGGGFLNPSGTPGDSSISGTVRRATVRLVAASPGFHDLLGPSELTVGFGAKKDPALAKRLETRLRSLLPAS